MINMLKKLTLVAFVLALVAALSACGNSSATQSGNQSTNSSKSNTNTNNSKKKTSDKTTTSASKSTSKPNLEGRTITIAAIWNADPAVNDKTAEGKLKVAQEKKVEKEYNVKIKYKVVPNNDLQKKFVSSVLAGQPLADLVNMNNQMAMDAAAKKQLIPIESFAPDMSKYPKLVKSSKFFGNNYQIGVPSYSFAGMYYNIKLFKQLNLPDPHELVKQGKWNWSEFEQIAKKATTNGQNKTWGFAGWDQEMMQFFLPSNDAQMVDMKTGKVNVNSQKVVQAYDFVNKLYNVDHVVKVEPKSTPDNWHERSTFKDGDVAMTYGWDWQAQGDYKGMDIGFVPFPMGPAAKSFVNPELTGTSGGWFIPKGVKNPKALVQVFNDLNNVKDLEDYPGQNWFEGQLKHQADIDAARKLAKSQAEVPYTFFNKFPNSNITKDIITNHKNVQSTLQAYQGKAQAVVALELKAKS